jgi:hypothetical protein
VSANRAEQLTRRRSSTPATKRPEQLELATAARLRAAEALSRLGSSEAGLSNVEASRRLTVYEQMVVANTSSGERLVSTSTAMTTGLSFQGSWFRVARRRHRRL